MIYKKNPQTIGGFYGGAKRDRTADLYNAIVALSQLSYSPLLPCLAYNAPDKGIAKTPIRFQFVQCQNAAMVVYRRGDTQRKQIFIWRRVFYTTAAKPMVFANIKKARCLLIILVIWVGQ